MRNYPEKVFSRPLEKGSAMHELLAGVSTEYQANGILPINLEERAELILRKDKYPIELAAFWPKDIDDIVKGAKWALSQIDPTASILAIENTFRRKYPLLNVDLLARIDLVLRHQDDSIQIVDFKSGSGYRGTDAFIYELVARATVGNAYPDAFIRNTTIYTGCQRSITTIYSRDDELVKLTWQEILAVIDGIRNEKWTPLPSRACDWCSYSDSCSIKNHLVVAEVQKSLDF